MLNRFNLDRDTCGGQNLDFAQRGTATHELGHALGLGHSFLPNVMSAVCDRRRRNTPQDHDRADYRQRWPAQRLVAPVLGLGQRARGAPGEFTIDPSKPEELVGIASHVFVGRVKDVAGDKTLATSDPEIELKQRQFDVEVLDSIKGQLSGKAMINQPLAVGGDVIEEVGEIVEEADDVVTEPGEFPDASGLRALTEEAEESVEEMDTDPLETGQRYLFAVALEPDEDWYTILAPKQFAAIRVDSEAQLATLVARFSQALAGQVVDSESPPVPGDMPDTAGGQQ